VVNLKVFEDKYYFGRRANGIYVPRYRNWGDDKRDYLRGFGYQGGASRDSWGRGAGMDGFGADFKKEISQPGGWSMNLGGFGEMLPDEKTVLHFRPKRKINGDFQWLYLTQLTEKTRKKCVWI
jgi:hypothetical protein